MTAPIKVLDGHMHLLTADTHREEMAWLSPVSPAVAAATHRRRERYEREQAVPSDAPADETVEEAAARWLGAFDRYGIAAGVFLALAPKPQTLRRFVAQRPDRLYAFTFVNPWEDGADTILEEDILRQAFRGLKLYPSIQRFHGYDERAYPVYARAEALGCPVLFHANVFVDTSGSGTWMRYLPRPLTRREVLERLLDVFGPDRILFGSDSRHASEGYRHWLLQEHREILEALRVPENDQRKILGGNMARLLRIPW